MAKTLHRLGCALLLLPLAACSPSGSTGTPSNDEEPPSAVPFPTEPFVRNGPPGRVALVELFTGAQCPPCVAADGAFDAALQTYQPRDVVLLQYHLHIPGPDPLTNADAEGRMRYYALRGVPSTYVNGGKDLGLGGPKGSGQSAYERLTKAIQSGLEAESPPRLQLAAKQSGDDVAITAEVSGLKETGEGQRLRLALAEEVVRYAGRNGQRFHHHVVRAMPGGVDGLALKGAPARYEAKVNLAELKESLAGYLKKANERQAFPGSERPLELKRLKVVAFVQDDKSKEVLQAAQVDLGGEE